MASCVAQQPHYDTIGFCNDVAQAKCQIAGTCSVDAYTCQSFQIADCTTKAKDVTAARTRVFNSDNATACVQALQAAFGWATRSIGYNQLQSLNDTCARAYAGTGAAGDYCRLDYDCQDGLICASPTPGSTPSVCAAPHPVQQGQDCMTVGSQCPADTYCAQQNGGAQCTQCPGAGAPCADQLYCMSAQRCDRGTCVARVGAGAPCVPGQDDCDVDNPYCDEYSTQCAPGMTFQPGSVDCLGLAGLRAMQPADSGGGGSGDDGGTSSGD
jgi:hypothetical protein